MPLGTTPRKVTRGWGLEAGRARRGAGHVIGVQTHGHVLALLGFWQGPAASASSGPHAPLERTQCARTEVWEAGPEGRGHMPALRALQPCSQLGMSRGAAEALQLCSSPGRPRHLQSTGGTTATSCPSPGRTSTSWPPGRTWPGMRTRSCRCVPGFPGRLAPGAAHHGLWGLWPHWHAQGWASPPHRGRLPWTTALASPLQPAPLSAARPGGRCGPGVETIFRRGRPAPGVTHAGSRGGLCVPAGPAPALESRRRAGAPGLLPAGVPAALRPLHHQAE